MQLYACCSNCLLFRGNVKKRHLVPVIGLLLLASHALCVDSSSRVLIRDISRVEGVRENPLIGYGIVVGLNGTGDRRQTIFTIQTLANAMQRMGVQIPTATARTNNVAAVFVTASLPPFARPGTQLDVTVSSIGDAKSLEGGMLLLTPLFGADGVTYAAAQGPVTLGGYSAGGSGTAKQLNHPTIGRIASGGLVERDTSVDLNHLSQLSLLLTEPNFSAADAVASAINQEFGRVIAAARDGRRIDLNPGKDEAAHITQFLARVELVSVQVHPRARVVLNERTGTIVMGKDVRLSAVSILHGGLSIEISTELTVSQPNPFSKGDTTVVPERAVKAEESSARRVELSEGASVEQLVSGLQAIGATARDVIAILQAIKSAGALQADLEII
jgi:flagellar P-ring protein FlgI